MERNVVLLKEVCTEMMSYFQYEKKIEEHNES